jgi:hypothetical protein
MSGFGGPLRIQQQEVMPILVDHLTEQHPCRGIQQMRDLRLAPCTAPKFVPRFMFLVIASGSVALVDLSEGRVAHQLVVDAAQTKKRARTPSVSLYPKPDARNAQ